MTRRLPILTYHSIDESGSPLAVSPALFRQQMGHLRAAGWKTLSLDELLEGHRRGEWPDRRLVVTFDDGLRSIAEHGLPVLSEHGFSALVFVVADRVGLANDWPGQPAWVPRQALLDWPMLRELSAAGVEMGAHTLSHPHLPMLGSDEAKREVLDSKRAIEDRIGQEVRAFAYPYGSSTPALEQIVGNAFLAGFGTRLSSVTQASRRALLDRIDVYYLRRPALFAGLGADWLEKYIDARRWLREWRARLAR